METPQAPSSDVVVEAPSTPEVKAPDVQSDRFAIFAKKEAALVREREGLKKDREQFLSEKKQVDEFRERINQFEELKKSGKGIEALRLAGLTDADIMNLVTELEPKEETVEDKAKRIAQEELGKYKTEQEEKESAAQAKRDEHLVGQFKGEISNALKAAPDELEYCNHYGPQAEELAYEYVQEVLKTEGKIIEPAEALRAIEKYYEDEDRALSALKKRAPKQVLETEQSIPLPPQAPNNKPDASSSPRPKVLTNDMTQTVASTVQRKETREQKKERLAEALRRGYL